MARNDPNERPEPLIDEVARMAARVDLDEPIEVWVLPQDRLTQILRAGIETYLIFSAREESKGQHRPHSTSDDRASRTRAGRPHPEERL